MTQKVVVDCSPRLGAAAEPCYTDLTPEEEEQRGMDANSAQTLAWLNLRAQRVGLLAACDWAVLPDAPLSERKQEEWVVYRQALRDLPSHTRNPATVVWPTPPG
jgi:hypothetical protein